MKYGYARGVTYDQVDSQKAKLKSSGAEIIYSDCGDLPLEERKGYLELISKARNGDTIVVTDMSRLGRNLKSILELNERGVIIDDLTNEFNNISTMYQLIKSVFSSLPEPKEIMAEIDRGQAQCRLTKTKKKE